MPISFDKFYSLSYNPPSGTKQKWKPENDIKDLEETIL